MSATMVHDQPNKPQGLLRRLAHDRSGNTLALLAAGLFPLLAMVGGGIDMGRSYLAQSRLQQACDAGVLAARKRLGSSVIVTGVVPDDVETMGNRFFNINFGAGAYGSVNRQFEMTLQSDLALTGTASVTVPTTIMKIFGYNQTDLAVTCQAQLNFSNTDVMFVLDTTGSMAATNPGDTQPRIDVMRTVVKQFHTQMEASKTPGNRVRYGFLPYSTNVRVADILKSDWMVDRWTYQSRVPNTPTGGSTNYYYANYEVRSGTKTPIAPYLSATCPPDTDNTVYGPSTEISASPHSYWYESTTNGTDYECDSNDGQFRVSGDTYSNYVVRTTLTFAYAGVYYWYDYTYRPVEHDVTPLKGATGDAPPRYSTISAYIEGNGSSPAPNPWNLWNTGCIEERDTYEITDWNNVDLTRALDLDIDRVPTPGNPATQWRPMIPGLIFEREIEYDGDGAFTVAPVVSGNYYFNPDWENLYSCPAPARKLGEMSGSDLNTYLASLEPAGNTYHDIGMIWGARMLSPTGIFAAENADIDSKPTSRHMIFLTDGQTETYDINYGSYGVEGLDRRRWRSAAESGISLDEVVERRYAVACKEAKKRNITVWVIAFGTSLNPVMEECAGPGRSFQTADSAELSSVFSKIAAQLGDLRLTR